MGVQLKPQMPDSLAEQSRKLLHVYGYSWLIYQTSLQIATLEKLIQGLALTTAIK